MHNYSGRRSEGCQSTVPSGQSRLVNITLGDTHNSTVVVTDKFGKKVRMAK